MLLGLFDTAAVIIAQSFAGPVLDLLFIGVSLLGSPAFGIIAASVIYWQGKEKKAMFLFNLLLITSAVVASIKVIFSVPRPAGNGIRIVPDNDIISRVYSANVPNFSFPSGHSATAAAAAFYFRNSPKGIALAALFVMPFAVAFSRMYLGMHFLSDVIAGLAIGSVIAAFNEKLSGKFERYEFRLSRLSDESIVILLVAVATAATLFMDVPLMALLAIGMYAGFFASREIGLRQKAIKGRKYAVKVGFGVVILALFTAISLAFPITAPIVSFIQGAWVSFGHPYLFNKMSE